MSTHIKLSRDISSPLENILPLAPEKCREMEVKKKEKEEVRLLPNKTSKALSRLTKGVDAPPGRRVCAGIRKKVVVPGFIHDGGMKASHSSSPRRGEEVTGDFV